MLISLTPPLKDDEFEATGVIFDKAQSIAKNLITGNGDQVGLRF